MCGFLTAAGGSVSLSGGKVLFTIPDGQKLLVLEDGDERTQYGRYRMLAEAPAPAPMPIERHWLLPEYVTWVEQKAAAVPRGIPPPAVLSDAFVRDFIRRIETLGLPKGKLTIDDGWQEHAGAGTTDGYWRVNRAAFPDMQGLCHYIEDKGFVPALWMGLPRVRSGAKICSDRPELFGRESIAGTEEASAAGALIYHTPSERLTEYYRDMIKPYRAMGFRKFKLDFYYGPRAQMAGLMRCAYEAVKSIDRTIEVEGHHPDIFYSRWTDAVRANDVNINNGTDWQGLTLAHLRVCELCAGDRIINIDHAGGNDPLTSEHDYNRHLSLFDCYTDMRRYPVISLLPDRYSPKAAEALRRYISMHTAQIDR